VLNRIARIFALLDRPTRRGMMWSGLLMGISTLLEMAGIGLLIPLFQMLLAPEMVERLPLLGPGLAAALTRDPTGTVTVLCLGLMGFFFAKAAVLGLVGWQQARFALDLQAEFAVRMLRDYLGRPYEALLGRNSADLIHNVTTLSLRLYVQGVLPLLQLATEVLAVLVMVGILVLVDPLVTLGVGITTIATVTLFYLSIRDRMRRWGESAVEEDRAALVWLTHSLGAPKVVKLGALEEFFIRRFTAPTRIKARAVALTLVAPTWPRLLLETVAVAAMLGVILITVAIASRPAQQVLPVLGVLAVAALRLLPSASKIIAAIGMIRENDSTIERLHREGFAAPSPGSPPPGPIPAFARALRLEGIRYTYPAASRPALEGIDLDIVPGESLALVGRSGAGKTTLADMILGLLPPEQGRILLDDLDITADPSGWQHLVGYVPQDIFLLDDTLARNIALGVEDQAIDPERLAEAVRLARLDAVIAALPAGLNTPVGERGTLLSGGQRQRVGIARALYRRPRVLVLDEATAALDAETEQEVTQAIAALAGECTLIVITHRLATVRHCQRLALIDGGQITAIGSFDQLAASNADFARLVALNQLESTASLPLEENVRS